MKKIVLVMDRKVLAEALLLEMKNNTGMKIYTEYDYHKATVSVDIFRPDAVLIELPETKEISAEECLKICDEIREVDAACKILLLAPEGDPKACELTIQAVRDGRIDDFLYYDTSMKYLISKLEAL